MSSTTSTATTATSSSLLGTGQSQQGVTIISFLTALGFSLIMFGVQIIAFLLIKDKLARIYKPKTYLVPERQRTEAPPRTPWGWLIAIFRFKDREIINKCGLDAYFFLRYLQTLLIIFVPMAVVVLPILIPINHFGGRGPHYAMEFGNATDSNHANVTGLDTLAWGNVRPSKTHRYWAHLVLALGVIIWVCVVFFAELRVYIKVRQDYLTSAEHRLRASATTVLVSAIPEKWLSVQALAGLYDVFPGGIRNIWINRKFDVLLHKLQDRAAIVRRLEAAETKLIRLCKKAQMKQLEKDEKTLAKQQKKARKTKEEKEKQQKIDDLKAQKLAQEGGTSAGDPHQVPHTMDDALDEAEEQAREQDHGTEHNHTDDRKGGFNIPVIGGGLAAVEQGLGVVGQGFGKGFDAAGKVGGTILGGARNVGKNLNNQVETTNGFMALDASPVTDDGDHDEFGRYRSKPATGNGGPYGAGVDGAAEKRDNDAETPAPSSPISPISPTSTTAPRVQGQDMRLPGNNVRQTTNQLGGNGTNDANNSWWKWWKGPAGGFTSPLPTGYEDGDEFPLNQSDGTREPPADGGETKKTGFLNKIPFLGHEESIEPSYPIAHDPDYDNSAHGAVWERYIKAKHRPHTSKPKYSWLPGFLSKLPGCHDDVDEIYYLREQLARLNLEIEIDQKDPDKFPVMNSAFVQFNHQVAAHMACQAVSHHIPKHMAPRMVEISPNDVLWHNMSISWWEAWVRTGLVLATVAGMIILWLIPVGWTASLAQLGGLAKKYAWLHWLNYLGPKVLGALAGVLPGLSLMILLSIVPTILTFLSIQQGAQTGVQAQRSVQNYYFGFLFVQVFLVVSISGGALAALGSATQITAIPDTLATQLPKASNYFFSYMLLQSLGSSAQTLLQVMTLFMWFVMPNLVDKTARQKWHRNTALSSVTWGTTYPAYTNLACIALIYSIVSPLIIVFAIITFILFWIANRYNMLYVTQFNKDTGGLLYPTAINQTFVGLYVMELCLVGLFFLVRDEHDHASCIPQAIIMVVAMGLTALFQVLLNWSFGPLLVHLPITFEDEAVLRDQAFEKAQARRLRWDADGEAIAGDPGLDDAIELTPIPSTMFPRRRRNSGPNPKLSPFQAIKEASPLTNTNIWQRQRERQRERHAVNEHKSLRKMAHHRDLDTQKKISDALYGGFTTDIEDMNPTERDILVRHAFQHVAIRARRPTVWIPRDDIGVSEDEIKRTREFTGNNIWISNVGAALDSKARVVYAKNPPDFSEVDLIQL